MKGILLKHFDIDAIEIIKLNGYDNANYLVKTLVSDYIFKTYKMDDDLFDLVMAETDLLNNLARTHLDIFPRPIKTHQGENIKCIEINGEEVITRMLTFLDGDFMAEVEHTPALFVSFGAFLAKMDLQMQNFRNYTIQAREYSWDIQHALLNVPFIHEIQEAENRKVVSYFLQQFDLIVIPILPSLRKSVIHGDANNWNILVNKGMVTGIIDFGDVVYTPLINELAVAITYAIMGKDDPIAWAGHIIHGYQNIFPVLPAELDILYYLIAARLCISACQSAHNKISDPQNKYISISEKPVWEVLHRWLEINPAYAKKEFRLAAGYPNERPAKIEDLIEQRHKHISPIVSISYANPIFMNRAAFQYMYDAYGNTYLDAYNNIPHVGHSHPKVVEAGQQQMAILNTNTRYVYELLNTYSERLLAKFPSRLNKIYFVNSGSAASDLAIRMARHHTNCQNIMVMEHGYHGHTQIGIDISDYKFNNKRGPGQKSFILKTTIPDVFRGKFNDENAGLNYALEAIDLLHNFNEPIAAFITEPIVGCGGQVPLASGYLKNLYPAIRKQGGVCISDEVQAGFGRLGEYFWGFEAHDVIPDIVIIGKPMGNGHPMGAVVTTEEIAHSFSNGVEFFSSFGGNPVSCAIGLAVLDVLEEEGLQQNAHAVGNHFKLLMNDMKQDFNCIGDVRGSGLFLGFEIVDEQGRQNTALAAHIKNELRNRNILISTDGPFDNVLKSKPPLCFTKSDVEKVVENIYEILKEE